MRNTHEYPVTLDEIVDCLQRLHNDIIHEHPDLIGDMRPLLLRKAISLIKLCDIKDADGGAF